ncbi:proline--tRNA ligase [Frankia sp. B2]|uniref:proline--tRNA ligase n=1 Tax=unclassified Frankia TaxID=2632575 RepID=UPI000461C2DE|nr:MULTISPECIES: proline--tRNA ligase [unclassified Frankia]KDA40610.1 prolyl-tRNA synthetase [Frankia sp. BMG5.23]OFB40459.1 proline--tRNA ligase [Frankia sp. CgIM4]TFE28324.1 proline--tRNA ligase [Frankia sp. B2]
MDHLSRVFARTLRDDPAEAETVNHKLLVRGGYVRKVASGIYTYLPLGLRVLRKVEEIVRQEMATAGCQEFLMPALMPRELWERTGRWANYGDLMFRVVDRKGAEFCLGPTHEELVTSLIANEISSYRELPLSVYQIQTKYRDEFRPRSGLIRARDFVMKDAYSFHTGLDSLRETYGVMYDAYERVFTRCGLRFRAVEAQAGEIGGDVNHEFMAPSEIGEDLFVYAPDGSYAANMEAASSQRPVEVEPGTQPLQRVHTPGVPGVEELAAHLDIPAARILKCVLYKIPRSGDERAQIVAALCPGDREINEYKLTTVLGAAPTLLDENDFAASPGLVRGYVGPQGLSPHVSRIVADHHVAAGRDWCTGANEIDYHVTGCNRGRDFEPDEYADVTNVRPGDPSPDGTGPLAVERSVEVGHIFQLGTKYSVPLGATFLDDNGRDAPMVMGCYGIGISRILSVVIEQHHDENGVVWPAALAPYDVEVIPLGRKIDWDVVRSVAGPLEAEGLDILVDDRLGSSAGVKFADADLIGCPVQVVIGRRAAEGIVEVRARDRSVVTEVDITDLPKTVERLRRSL